MLATSAAGIYRKEARQDLAKFLGTKKGGTVDGKEALDLHALKIPKGIS